ncbi:anti-sigma factor [Humitalea sp. 24SJ18S-53]|uniref:anti-sigma factor n=1 Tax=Humitalea sp. 24SJ18S-53 TaxID=3422307 RepID=UPI003D664D14
MIPRDDPAALDALAGEYVLGSLEARDAAEVAAALPTTPALAAAVAAWEARLAPLADLAPPQSPPEGLWSRIDAALPVRPSLRLVEGAPAVPPAPVVIPLPRPDGRPAPPPYSPRIWRAWALGATAVAAGLAAFLLVRPPAEQALMTVLLTSQDQPAWLVESTPSGAISLAAVNPGPVAPDRVLQLWALPQGATAPTSLGFVPAQGRVTVTAPASIRPEPGMLIEISLEPPGGSPLGRPSGPVLFIGRLVAARGA